MTNQGNQCSKSYPECFRGAAGGPDLKPSGRAGKPALQGGGRFRPVSVDCGGKRQDAASTESLRLVAGVLENIFILKNNCKLNGARVESPAVSSGFDWFPLWQAATLNFKRDSPNC